MLFTVMKFTLSICFTLLLNSNWKICSAAEDQCIWYGECGTNTDNDQPINCEYRGPPKEITDTKYTSILRNLCPEFVDASGKALTCCDGQQIKTFELGKLRLAQQFLQRCPSCWHNFKRFYCMLTCSPQQSQFLKTIDSIESDSIPNKKSITKVQFFVKSSYADAFYKSCQNVEYSGGEKVMNIMCGDDNNHETCTSKLWLENMGNNVHAPFKIQFNFSENTVDDGMKKYYPLDLPVSPCNKPVELHGSACACTDCPDVCDNQPLYELPDRDSSPFAIGNIDGMVFIAVILFILLMFSFLFFLIFSHSVRGVTFRNGKLSASSTKETSKESLPLQDSVGNGEDGKSEAASTPRVEKKQHANDVTHPPDPTAVIVHVPNWYQTLSIQFEGKVEAFFYRWGYYCAKNPFIVVSAGLFISSLLSLGILFFSVVTEPIELWAMPDSRARLEKEYFDSHFQPFYRTEQIIITPKKNVTVIHENQIFGPVFQDDFLNEAWILQKKIELLTANNKTVHLRDICYMPMAPDNNNCAIMSLFSYKPFQNNKNWTEGNKQHLEFLLHCFRSPMQPSCLGEYGGPLFPYVTLGGFPGTNYTEAQALVITILVNNYYDKSKVIDAMAWEAEFINLLKSYNTSRMNLHFSSERSIQDELDRESRSDISTILISYVIMFCYISIGLGQANSCQRLLIDSKITLGLGGIILVIFSVMTSVGIFGFCGIPATLIVIEVVPFMCLAVGVDNIFILVQAYQRDERQPNEPRENQIGRVVSVVAPSMFLSSITDACGFYLGAMSSMPAVQTFGLYAGTALLIAFFMQITCFVSLLSLDSRRIDNGKMDVCCWIQTVKNDYISPSTGLLYRIFKNIYSPFLMKTPIRIVVIITFITWLCSSVAVLNKIEIGLDQELSMPRDSYMLHYFEAMKEYLAVGPPVYFVIKSGFDYSNINHQNAICSGVMCHKNSILNELNFASHDPRTYIAQDASSWLDDYTSWATIGSCCRETASGEFCPSTNKTCNDCPITPQIIDGVKRVEGDSFVKYLNSFLKDNPSPRGCIGGHAAYSGAVQMLNDGRSIGATQFMTYHTVLKSSKDYYEALWWARYISDRLSETLNSHVSPSTGEKYEVFPYSIFYVFYEQYLTIWRDTLKNLFYSLLTIFIMSFFLLGLQLYLAVIICITVSMIVINLMGMMYWWNIQLNAVSLVNLVVAVGIAVEFCSHISRAFGVSTKETKILRTQEALTNMGSSVLCGITLTKFTGILVLYFAKSLIFQIFYFRINLCIVLFGAAHGLIFLPCLLSFFGPAASKRKLNEQQQSLLETQYRTDETENAS